MPGDQVTDRLAADLPGVDDLQIGTHLHQRLEQAGPKGIQQHTFHRHLGSGRDESCHHGEGRRGGVAGNGDIRTGESLPPHEANVASVGRIGDGDFHSKGPQHPLGVVAGRLRLDHLRQPCGPQTGEEHR